MKVLLLSAFVVFTTTSALQQKQYGSAYNSFNNDNGGGQYHADDSGQYVPDDSGKYIPDHSGDYHPDGLGGYINDGTGIYKGDGSGAYKGQNENGGAYRGDGEAGQGQFGGSAFGKGRFPASKQLGPLPGSNLIGLGSNQDKQTIKFNSGGSSSGAFGSGTALGQGAGNAFGETASATSQVASSSFKSHSSYGSSGKASASGVRYDQGTYADGRWKIIRQSGDVDTDGYHWEYETENGITAEESGKLANKGTDLEAMKAKGFFQYTGPDNVLYYVSYTADENGFIPQGDHLPTPPPIPAQIVRSLEYLKSIGKL